MRWRPRSVRFFLLYTGLRGISRVLVGTGGPGLHVRPGFSFSGEPGADYRGGYTQRGKTALAQRMFVRGGLYPHPFSGGVHFVNNL